MLTTKLATKLFAALLLAITALIAAPTAAHAGLVYVAGSGNEFGTLDLSTGTFTQISTFNLDGGSAMFGMGTAFGTTLTGVAYNGEAYLINTTTGNTFDLGPTGGSPIGAGGTNSILYTFDSVTSVLSSLNFANLVSTPIGTYNFAGDGLVVQGQNGIVYVGAATNGNDELYAINTSTGVATDLGDTGVVGLYAGVYSDGMLYGFGYDGSIDVLNTTTGAATVVGTYSLPNGDSIDAAATFPDVSVPEPSSLTLMGFGIVVIAVRASRRRVGRLASDV